MSAHLPVLLDDVVALLEPRPGRLFVDGTLGMGGHTAAFLEAGASVIACDRDPWAIEQARARLAPLAQASSKQASSEQTSSEQTSSEQVSSLLTLHHSTFSRIPSLLGEARADAILLDLGVSSPQLDQAERGFSFRSDGPLDMRMDPSVGQPLSEVLPTLDEATLADILFRYGEERQSRRVARAIREALPITRTSVLADVVARVLRPDGRIHPATRTFQALRIYINRELDELEHALATLPSRLAIGGRLGIISFHSLEDRLVKQTFRTLSGEDAPRDLRGHPLTPPHYQLVERRARKGEERDPNPRARSARLRVLERLS